MTNVTSHRSILGIVFGFWPWSKEVAERGTETWCKTFGGHSMPGTDFARNWVLYRVTNRYTGSVTLRKVYLD